MARAVGTRTDRVHLPTGVAAAAAGVPFHTTTEPAAGGNSKTASVARTAGMSRGTAAAGRGRPAPYPGREHYGLMQPASAAEVIVIGDSDDEPAEVAAGVLGAGEGGAVFLQPGELIGKAGVKQEPHTEVCNPLAAVTAAALEVCSGQAAVLVEGVPAAPMLEAVEAQAALAAAGEQMARDQQLRGTLEPGLNAKEAVVECRIDGATPRVPGEAAAAGASSGNAFCAAAAAAGCAIGLENSAPKVHVPATAAAATYGDDPLGVGLIEGEQASAKLQADAAADCSAGSGEATAVLAGGGL